jgi:signal transduction histidine kinase
MHVLPRQVTYGNILRVLLAGFGLVILLLVVAGFIGTTNIRSIQRNAATIVQDQQEFAALIDAIQHEQEALSAVFYNLSREPEFVDRAKILAELDTADNNIGEIVDRTEGSPSEAMGRQLEKATEAFATEARRLLGQAHAPTLLSRDLFQRHRQVTTAVARLVVSGHERSQAAQEAITLQSRRLFTQSLVFLGASLALALIFSVVTVRMTTGLFRKMEWQASELSRVSWHMLESQESTARRFSHELHDELGQALTALKANVMSLNRTKDSENRIGDCVALVDGAIQNVRELSQLLRPTILDDFGLDASLRWLAEKFTERTAIDVDYQSDFSGRLPDETETHLFRIAQEALTNVARHSKAKRVEVRLHANHSRLRLTITDNGVGLAQPGDATERGMGMIGMRARARSAGGEVAVRSLPDQGVSVEVQVPTGISENDKEDTHPAGG